MVNDSDGTNPVTIIYFVTTRK